MAILKIDDDVEISIYDNDGLKFAVEINKDDYYGCYKEEMELCVLEKFISETHERHRQELSILEDEMEDEDDRR